MKNTTLLLFMAVIVLIVGVFLFSSEGGVTGKSISAASNGNNNIVAGDLQKLTLSMKNYNYYPSEIKVKVNQPVEITLDDSVRGCLRAFAIRDLGISQYSKSPDQKIVFTPTQKGTFKFSCSMGMGYGTIIIE